MPTKIPLSKPSSNPPDTMRILHQFLKKTQNVSILLGIAILLIIGVNWLAPANGAIPFLLKLIILAVLAFAFNLNYKETAKLVKTAPELLDNTKIGYTGFRSNIILSYTLCIALAGLITYISYSIFF